MLAATGRPLEPRDAGVVVVELPLMGSHMIRHRYNASFKVLDSTNKRVDAAFRGGRPSLMSFNHNVPFVACRSDSVKDRSCNWKEEANTHRG